ncbi:TraR/DksA family transcriptional regulator [Amaricoccus sp.]|uniref:TraR/DksA family transcriptional regulator n=1 Tax=Amaricoccus sp. TaxID=1872485 RepID=UPI0039E2D9B7
MAIDDRKVALEARLAELHGRLARIEGELEQPASENFSEQATEREDEEVLEDLGASGLQEIRMIEAALDRIRQGGYGICVKCGEEIEARRLDLVPAAPLCADCAREA